MKTTPWILTLTLMGFLCIGCAGSGQAVAWDDSMQGLFSSDPDNPTSHPRRLWSKKEEERFLKQMGYADAAALGTVKVVSQCDRYGQRQVTLELHVKEVLHGDLGDELEEGQKLSIRIDADSHRSTVQTARSTPGSQFLVFLKRKPQGDQTRLSFDFYRPNPRLMTEVRSMYSRL